MSVCLIGWRCYI